MALLFYFPAQSQSTSGRRLLLKKSGEPGRRDVQTRPTEPSETRENRPALIYN